MVAFNAMGFYLYANGERVSLSIKTTDVVTGGLLNNCTEEAGKDAQVFLIHL